MGKCQFRVLPLPQSYLASCAASYLCGIVLVSGTLLRLYGLPQPVCGNPLDYFKLSRRTSSGFVMGFRPRRPDFCQLLMERRSPMSYDDRNLTCADCGQSFIFSADDQAYHAEKGYTNEPKRCPTCRQSRRDPPWERRFRLRRRRVLSGTTGDALRGLRRVRPGRPSPLQAPRRPSSLLQRLLQPAGWKIDPEPILGRTSRGARNRPPGHLREGGSTRPSGNAPSRRPSTPALNSATIFANIPDGAPRRSAIGCTPLRRKPCTDSLTCPSRCHRR